MKRGAGLGLWQSDPHSLPPTKYKVWYPGPPGGAQAVNPGVKKSGAF